MPNCFQLYPVGSSEAATLHAVDAAIAAHLGVPVDAKEWCCGWYHCIGLLIALLGHPLGSRELREAVIQCYGEYPNPEALARMLQILDFLTAGYRSDAWAEVGRSMP